MTLACDPVDVSFYARARIPKPMSAGYAHLPTKKSRLMHISCHQNQDLQHPSLTDLRFVSWLELAL